MTKGEDARRVRLPVNASSHDWAFGPAEPLNELNLHLGMMLELFRVRRSMTQHEVAKAIHVAPQEIADYETGQVRIPPVRLLELSTLLGAPLSAFFHDL